LAICVFEAPLRSPSPPNHVSSKQRIWNRSRNLFCRSGCILAHPLNPSQLTKLYLLRHTIATQPLCCVACSLIEDRMKKIIAASAVGAAALLCSGHAFALPAGPAKSAELKSSSVKVSCSCNHRRRVHRHRSCGGYYSNYSTYTYATSCGGYSGCGCSSCGCGGGWNCGCGGGGWGGNGGFLGSFFGW
jgi:hypothetical protein